jgi:hypothetical protein
MSRSERYLPRHARGSGPVRRGGPRRPRHASPLTGYRRWRNRHDQGVRRRRAQPVLAARRLARVAGWVLLVAGSTLVYLLAWQAINDTVSTDSQRPPAHGAPACAPDNCSETGHAGRFMH